MRKYRLHWTLHPEKDRAWYEAEKLRMSEDEVARELDINYAMSMSGKVFPEYNDSRHFTNEPFKWSKHRPIYRVWDFGGVNACLFVYVDEFGRKRFLHERMLGVNEEGQVVDADKSNTLEQVQVVLQDCQELFPEHRDWRDICDPAGADDSGIGSTHVDILRSEGVDPDFLAIREISTRQRRRNGIEAVKTDLQKIPGGEEAFKIYVSPDGTQGCPILRKALMGGYCYKKDYNGNVLDKIKEPNHPYEDIVDCLLYFYLETDNGRTAGYSNDPSDYRPIYSDGYRSPYLGF